MPLPGSGAADFDLQHAVHRVIAFDRLDAGAMAEVVYAVAVDFEIAENHALAAEPLVAGSAQAIAAGDGA